MSILQGHLLLLKLYWISPSFPSHSCWHTLLLLREKKIAENICCDVSPKWQLTKMKSRYVFRSSVVAPPMNTESTKNNGRVHVLILDTLIIMNNFSLLFSCVDNYWVTANYHTTSVLRCLSCKWTRALRWWLLKSGHRKRLWFCFLVTCL